MISTRIREINMYKNMNYIIIRDIFVNICLIFQIKWCYMTKSLQGCSIMSSFQLKILQGTHMHKKHYYQL